MIRAS